MKHHNIGTTLTTHKKITFLPNIVWTTELALTALRETLKPAFVEKYLKQGAQVLI